MIGQTLGPYRIESKLGEGGMGEVYRATDTKLKRDVAIKVLPESVAADPDRLARFQREAETLAALNHPGIAAIYGIEEASGSRALVMELVDGPTLADRIALGPIALDEAIPIARQIADALEAAHEQGIIHRDLKPANIKLRPDGTVKILDFGLAKAVEPVGAGSSGLSRSPTITTPAMTQAGIILGTAAYMAPEQARGRAVDKRADIWAFGVVLYEMVTGRRLFDGEDLTDTLARVVRDQVDVSAAPLELRGVLDRCLQKDPKKRLRDISAFALLVERPPEVERQVRARPRTATVAPWAVAAAAVAGVTALAFVHFREAPPELQAVEFAMEAPPDGAFANMYGAVGVSPDGRSVVFSAAVKGAVSSLWVRPLDSLVARPLPGTAGGNFPTWSPDSRSLAFLADGKLKRIEIAGGAPLTLGDATAAIVTPTGSWNRDGVILFGSAAGLQRVSASGGGATPLTKVDSAKQETGHGYPQFLPDGKRFLYFVLSADASVQGVYASSLDNPGQRQQILRTAAKAVYVPPRASYPGYLLWVQDQSLRAQRFDVGSLKLAGDPVSVVEDVGLNPTAPNRAAFWSSDTGLLAYFSSAALNNRPLAWFARDGKRLGEAAPDDLFNSLALAPGAQRVAVERSGVGSGPVNRDIWLWEFARGVMTRLTFDAGVDEWPVWSPDGNRVAFSSIRGGVAEQIYLKDASGVGQEERLTEGINPKLVLDWSKDGKYLLYRELSPKTQRDLMVLPLAGDRKPIPLVTTPFLESTGAISPDVGWVAYASNDSGRYEVYVQAFPGAGVGAAGRWQISTNGGYDVKWRGDGKEIYYESFDGKVMAAAVQTSPQGVRAETPRELFSADFTNAAVHQFDVTSDGQRFLLALNPSAANSTGQRLMVVHNWQAALRK